MGLYLCSFDDDEEVDGVEVGAYEYFAAFRDSVSSLVENNNCGSVCPKLMLHSSCDGEWSYHDCKELLNEFSIIAEVFKRNKPQEAIIAMKKDLFSYYELRIENLYDCFIDVNGENLIERLSQLCLMTETRILFQ